ncbi:MAG: Fic family protein [Bacilli bacterium]
MKRSGTYVNNLSGKLSYQSFKPSDLPPSPTIVIDANLNESLKSAYLLFGKLDGILALIPNQALFLSMYVRKEALLSSQIEGTQASLDDLFDSRIKANVNRDVEDVIQYLKALEHANSLIAQLPISVRFMREMHTVLLTSSRGQDKQPGELRKTQNWIGAVGSSLQSARYVPPNVSDMHLALASLECYIHEEEGTDPLIKIALIHYQFESIHPFLDGNGRVGRLLTTLLLKQYNLLSHNILYLSYFLKKNRSEYYDRLTWVGTKGDYEGWIRFFVEGVIQTAAHALQTIDSLLKLRAKNLVLIDKISAKPRKTALLFLTYLEAHPIIDIKTASDNIGKAFNTVSNAVLTFVELGILKKIEGDKRYRIYAYEDYLSLFRDGTE